MVDMDNKINQIGTASGKKEFVKMQQKVFDVRFEWHSHYPFFYDATCL